MKNTTSKRILSIALALMLMLALIPTAVAANKTFSDVKQGDWYYDVVTELASSGVISGYPDGSFKPNQNITRMEIASLILKAFPDGLAISTEAPAALTTRVAAANPGYWGNDLIAKANLQAVDRFGITKSEWDKPATREDMAYILTVLYITGTGERTFGTIEGSQYLVGDYQSAVVGSFADAEILWMYGNGIVVGVNDNGDFQPKGNATRAQVSTILHKILHPETWKQYDWEQVYKDYLAKQQAKPQVSTDFTGKSRTRYTNDVAYDYCRALEEKIGIQIFYLPEWTEKTDGLLHHSDMDTMPIDSDFFKRVLAELKVMSAAFDLYPEGFIKEVVQKKGSRGAEIILCPYTFEGVVSFGVHVYDYSNDAKKIDQIYYTGQGDVMFYSHEMGHLVMSSMAILKGFSDTVAKWESYSTSGTDYVSIYAMSSRAEDWAETWAYLWHKTDQVTLMAEVSPGLMKKVKLLTQLMEQYSSVNVKNLPWASIL